MDIQKSIGEKIRMYRKAKKMSLESLSSKIYKSKSIISKYELGESSFDMDTLYKIAEALEIEPAQLFEPLSSCSTPANDRYGVFVNNRLYAYMLVKDRSFHLIKSLMTFNGGEDDSATFYMQVPDFERYTECKVPYYGKIFCYPGNVVINLRSQTDSSDHAVLYAAIRMNQPDTCLGMIMMSGYATNDPGALKILLSKKPIEDDELITQYLTIDRKDLTSTKNSNIFTYNNNIIDADIFQ